MHRENDNAVLSFIGFTHLVPSLEWGRLGGVLVRGENMLYESIFESYTTPNPSYLRRGKGSA